MLERTGRKSDWFEIAHTPESGGEPGYDEHEAWLRTLCSDNELRAKIIPLLNRYRAAIQDDADESSNILLHETGSWDHSGVPVCGPALIAEGGPGSFTPQAVISAQPAETPRLLTLSMVFNLIATGAIFSRVALRDHDLPYLDAIILLALALGIAFGVGAFLRQRRFTGSRSFGQYHLLHRIGMGGMGEVYLAEHQLLKRPCAVKLIRPDSADDPKALARFEREVRLTATLSHPNTVEIYDYGRTSDGAYYYVMEYLPGLNLEELVERHGPLPAGRVVYLLRQVCRALSEAHRVGLIHRDIKPSNIIAAHRGGMDDVAKLVDFGLVRFASAPSAHSLSDGRVAGTPLFMSPEQVTNDRELDARSDIYSLGTVAYYLLTGHPPFEKLSGMAVMVAHVSDRVVPPTEIATGIPVDLEQVVLRCLAKRASDRFADAASLEKALSECACSASWNHDRAARWWQEVATKKPLRR